MTRLNQIKGCLLGGAIGDALGYPIEFMSAEHIYHRYGPDGLTDYLLTDGIAQISDDTQMTLFTADALLCAQKRFPQLPPDEHILLPYIFHCYQDWFLTQTQEFPLADNTTTYSSLIHIPELFARRSPGTTCMEALRSGQKGTIEHPINDSKGCGGIMRVAPIGLYAYHTTLPKPAVALLGAKAAAITHGHELGYIPAAALVYMIAELSSNTSVSIQAAVQGISPLLISIFPMTEHLRQLLTLIDQAQMLATMNISPDKAFEVLGQGWVAEETLAIAIYCALKYSDNFEKGVLAAVNHSGDSDSTGSITGQILGAALGFEAIPKKFIDVLELKEVILKISHQMVH